MGAAVRFKHTNVPRQQGEQARLKVVQGPDYGAVFVITGTKSTIGRGEENDIMVSDLKTSRRHAEFSSSPVGWVVKDLGSANGLLHNGKNTRNAQIKSGDTLTFGETTLEFITADSGTMMLVAPPRSVSQLHAENSAFEDQKKRIRGEGVKAPPMNGKVLIFLAIGVVVVLGMMMYDPEKPKTSSKRKGPATTEDLSKFLPESAIDPGTAKPAEQFFREGFREYMAHNYLRARNQFETVLQMAPSHELARIYLENSNKQIEDEVKFHLEHGKKSQEAGRLKDAKGHYAAIQRILYRDQSNKDFVEAKDQLEKVMKEMNTGGAKP